MSVPFVDLKQQYRHLKDEIDAAVMAVLESAQFIQGPAVDQFESELAAFVGCRHAIGVSSGTDALVMALLARNIGAGDAVFVPAFTYTATAEVILLVGARPVFVDVDPETFLIDLADLATKIATVRTTGTLRPAAIMPVDLFGQPADYPAINALAESEDLFVIADAAQGLGGALGERRVGTMAHCTATSFFPAKPLGCYGDGGAIMTDDDELADVFRSIRAHGKGVEKYDIVRLGLNARLDTLQAAILSVKLRAFPAELDAREALSRYYDDALTAHVTRPVRVPESRSAWAQYTLKTPHRDALKAALQDAGIPASIFYPRPMHLQPAYMAYGDGPGSLPVSERLSDEVLSLPMHPYMDDATRAKIADAVNAAAEQLAGSPVHAMAS